MYMWVSTWVQVSEDTRGVGSPEAVVTGCVVTVVNFLTNMLESISGRLQEQCLWLLSQLSSPYFILVCNEVSLCIIGWLWTWNLPVSASQVLGFQEYTPTPPHLHLQSFFSSKSFLIYSSILNIRLCTFSQITSAPNCPVLPLWLFRIMTSKMQIWLYYTLS